MTCSIRNLGTDKNELGKKCERVWPPKEKKIIVWWPERKEGVASEGI